MHDSSDEQIVLMRAWNWFKSNCFESDGGPGRVAGSLGIGGYASGDVYDEGDGMVSEARYGGAGYVVDDGISLDSVHSRFEILLVA